MSDDNAVLDLYHDEKSKTELHESIDAFIDGGGAFCDLGRFAHPGTLLDESLVYKDDRNFGYLVSKGEERQEVLVSMTGVLVEADLPPYRDQKGLFRTRPTKKDIPVNRVSIGWYGHENYERARVGLENVRSHFSVRYGEIDKIPLPVKGGVPLISCENRIVSKSEHVAAGERDVLMPKSMDPKSVLKNNFLTSPRFRYVADNVVSFARLVPSENPKEFETAECLPEEFKVGLVVCVQFAPTVIPTTKGTAKLVLKLRNLLIVDDASYKRCVFQIRLGDIERLPKPGAGLKRSAAPPQWISPNRRSGQLGDVEMLTESEKHARKRARREPELNADDVGDALSRFGIGEQGSSGAGGTEGAEARVA